MRIKLKNARNAYEVFFIVFLLTFLLQGLFVSNSSFLDLGTWSKGAELLAAGNYPSPEDFIFGYPGTLFLLPASFFIKLGFNSLLTSKIVMVASLSLFIAWAALICYKLRRDSLWWAYTGIILSANPCYVKSTPPSAHIAVLGCVIVLMTLYIFERKEKPALKEFILFGIIGGLSIISRFDFGLAFYFGAAIILIPIHLYFTIISIIIALIISLVATPFIWNHPISYFISVLNKILGHTKSLYIIVTGPTENYFKISTIYGLLSLAIGIYLIFHLKRKKYTLKIYLAWLTSFTIILMTLLLSIGHHPPWFIFPMAISWDALIPLLILTLKDEMMISDKQKKILIIAVVLAHIASYMSENIA